MTLPLGEALDGKYEILDKIGEGGMGSVYKVRHRLLEEVRVIKVLRPHAAEMEDLQRRFLREARMAIRLKHPNIAQLHDFSIAADGTAFIVMEFIDGVGLDAMIRAVDPPSIDLALELGSQALAALDYLHEHQFVHRDVSPDNVMLTRSFDGTPHVKLIDLGIAKNLGAEAPLTQTGVFLGKVRYCSPEQFSGKQGEEQDIDRGSDIYSFGVLLYELLTGVYPFNGESFAELAGSHLFQPPHDFETTDPDGRVPQGLRDVVLKSLAKDRSERFATAAEFSGELSSFREPETPLSEEFDDAVERTTAALPERDAYGKPGSTQGRLNREFGLETTAAPTLAGVDAGSQATAVGKTLEKIEKALAAAKLAKAEKLLGSAVETHGQLASFADLRERLEAAKVMPPERAPGRIPTPLKIGAGLVAIAVVATAGAWWAFSTDGATTDAQASTATSEIISDVFAPTPRWSPDSKGSENLEIMAVAPTEPPPFEDESAADVVPEPQPRSSSAMAEPAIEPSAPASTNESDTPPAPPRQTVEPAVKPPVQAELFQPGVGVVAPVLLELPTPQLPAGVKAPKDEIVYSIRVLVSETGEVASAQVEGGPGFKRRLKEAALAAARQAKFRPASRDGVVGKMWTEVRVAILPR